MVPAYTDIAHFRAPYKNAVFSGFGAEATLPAAATFATSPDGASWFNSVAATTVLNALDNGRVIEFVGSGTGGPVNVEVVPYASPAEKSALPASINARTWVQTKIGEGYTVLMSKQMMGGKTVLQAIKSKVEAGKAATNSSVAILVTPKGVYGVDPDSTKGISTAGLLDWFKTPMGMAAAGVGVVGLLYLWSTRK